MGLLAFRILACAHHARDQISELAASHEGEGMKRITMAAVLLVAFGCASVLGPTRQATACEAVCETLEWTRGVVRQLEGLQERQRAAQLLDGTAPERWQPNEDLETAHRQLCDVWRVFASVCAQSPH